jgi:hypothetical protein
MCGRAPRRPIVLMDILVSGEFMLRRDDRDRNALGRPLYS